MKKCGLKLRSVAAILVFVCVACHGDKHTTGDKGNSESLIRKKYATLLGVSEKEITNIQLYKFIDEWYSVPYKYGGKSKSGVDCSGFVSNLYAQVYKKTIAGSANSIYEESDRVAEKNLTEGNFVFFKINSDKVSHIGVYLKNRKFVHASTHKGVIISSLDDAYYKKYFFKGGKLK